MSVKQLLFSLTLLVALTVPATTTAHKDPTRPNRPATAAEQQRIDFRSNCDNAVAQVDMAINNVRARLTTGGDVWWDGSDGRYVVPKPAPGLPEVSSIFAGAVWLGGRDPGGGLKVAAQDYGRSGGQFDYYPGPLTAEGTTDAETCARWDRFFIVRGDDIREFLALYNEAEELDALPLDPSVVPESLLQWPGKDNPHFATENRFDLPPNQALAGFWDEDEDGIYDPTFGDYPIIEIRNCNELPQFPDEMIFWIYNDAGNVHRQSGTPNQIQMEVQVQAFAYESADDFNSMTFQRYKLINRAQEDILDTYFAMWVDPDLGCFTDDYVGCDTIRDLAYVYNEDELDGANGCTCTGGVQTYCDEIPLLGVDYFRGPRAPIFDPVTGAQTGETELGMSSFIYINNGGIGDPAPATTDPNTAEEYYNYLQGIWRDGTPLTDCESGYDQPGCNETRFAFSSEPNDGTGWSMVTADLPFGDRRTLQASGPFTLQPGAVNELIIGVVWVPDITYPAPSLQRLQQADDLAQDLFDNCFDRCDGPDAPDVDIVELDREVILLLSNPRSSNNFMEQYTEPGLGIPPGADSLYRFEGYRIFQLSGPTVTLTPEDIADPNRVREIATFDVKNGVTELFNWRPIPESDQPDGIQPILVPSLVADGNDTGIRHSLRITEDAFADGDESRLINHRRYYYAVVAYGYNNFQSYDPTNTDNPGQPTQYKASSQNIGDPSGTPAGSYEAIPRPILDRELMAEYGDGAAVTRLSGVGNPGVFLDLDDDSEQAVADAFAAGETVVPELTYADGAGPIEVFVVDPRNITDGEYEITFVDEDMSNERLDDEVRWVLRSVSDPSLPTIMSERTLDDENEQLIPGLGFAVNIAQVAEPGEPEAADNGAVGAAISYADPDADRWLLFAQDNFFLPIGGSFQVGQSLFDFVNTEPGDRFEEKDPNQNFNQLIPIYPYQLMDQNERANGIPFITPAWTNRSNSTALLRQSMDDLTNINIVLTSNKELWSRCPVVETANAFYEDEVLDGEPVGNDLPEMFDLRDAPSVSREAGDDGLPARATGLDPDFDRGLGWFPGYAYDVETGQRLEIFWGENSLFDGRQAGTDDFNLAANGADMVWNPSNTIFEPVPNNSPFSLMNLPVGGQHFVYITRRPYDAGAFLHGRFRRGTSSTKTAAIRDILWAGIPLLAPDVELRSYADGIIPNDVTLKLRVNNAYDFAEGTDDANGYPTYRFKFDGKGAQTNLDDEAVTRALDAINIVPNPYYGFSGYEDRVTDTEVKITNLPAQATVTIYSLDGKFIRKYERDEAERQLVGSNRALNSRQVSPALQWDLKNFRGIPVSSGIYLIHVAAPGLGERTLKFFGVQRQFDPSGL